jgi:hypothetical protein
VLLATTTAAAIAARGASSSVAAPYSTANSSATLGQWAATSETVGTATSAPGGYNDPVCQTVAALTYIGCAAAIGVGEVAASPSVESAAISVAADVHR